MFCPALKTLLARLPLALVAGLLVGCGGVGDGDVPAAGVGKGDIASQVANAFRVRELPLVTNARNHLVRVVAMLVRMTQSSQSR